MMAGEPNMKQLDKIWSRIGSVTMNEVVVAVLEDEILISSIFKILFPC